MRVLVVEDEPRLAETVRRGLTAEGVVVEVADNGVDGLWMGTNATYDVIVLDIMLPRLNGYDVLKGLRAKDVWTPVLMLTAKDGEYDQADAFDLGADDYLTKPFSFVVLVARLRALQRRSAPPCSRRATSRWTPAGDGWSAAPPSSR
jgi:two-component system OmpR family response regulator